MVIAINLDKFLMLFNFNKCRTIYTPRISFPWIPTQTNETGPGFLLSIMGILTDVYVNNSGAAKRKATMI